MIYPAKVYKPVLLHVPTNVVTQASNQNHKQLVMGIRVASLVFLLGASFAAAQCPQVHIFGARETTAPPGYGTAGSVVTNIQNAFPGATAEVINYPACGGQASCGGASYASSATQGVAAVASQVNSFNSRCPSTVLVLVGYSQVCILI